LEKQDLEILVSDLLLKVESGELERHEIHARIHQTLDQMRAFDMPLPNDLVALEQELASEFELEAQEKK